MFKLFSFKNIVLLLFLYQVLSDVLLRSVLNDILFLDDVMGDVLFAKSWRART